MNFGIRFDLMKEMLLTLACQGDSGGPMVLFSESRDAKLIAIVSWGKGCARRRYPGVYARVQSAREWIFRVTGI